jgi:predicted permease
MKLLSSIRTLFTYLFRRSRVEREMEEELRSHLQSRADDLERQGLSRGEAERQARIEFGGYQRYKEECREALGTRLLGELLPDARYAVRQLRRSAGFTAVAVLTLSLGIGANTAIFSMVNAAILRTLPFKDPSRLSALHEGIPKMGYPKVGFSAPDFVIFAREQKSFSRIGAFRDEQVDISGQGEPERVMAARVSASLFPMLGAEPMLGRTFLSEEDAPGHNVVLLSYELWQRRYGGDPGIIGRTIRLDRQPFAVIGIMPRNFEFPLPGPPDNGSPAELWVPMAFTPAELQGWGGSYFNSVLGRLRPGVTLDQARSEAESLSRLIAASYPAAIADAFRQGQLIIGASPFQEEAVGSVRPLLLVLMAAVAFVLLIACANLATLLLSRAAARQKEIAIRRALGATRLRLVRQMLTESLILALAGGALGCIVAYWARNLILALVPVSVHLPRRVPLDGSVIGFAIGASLLAALVFGLAPALQLSAWTTQGPLPDSGRGQTLGRSRHRLQRLFVTAEFVLAFILLAGAGLLIRSFWNLLETDPGFRPDHVLTLNIPLARQAYPEVAQVQGFYKQLLDQVSNLPGVRNAGLSNDLPLTAKEMVSIRVEGSEGAEKTPQGICQSWVLGGYFHVMGIPLLRGRTFAPEDRLETQPVAIVSLSMARKFWPHQDPVGKRIRWGVKDPWETIVGVVGDVSQGAFSSPLAPHVYRPYNQLPASFLENDPFGDWHAMNLVVRTQMDPASLTSAILAQVHSLDPELAVASIRTMTQVISSSVAGPEFNAALLGALAGLALFLAAIGVYGVLAYAVVQQTHEIGIRMALGAKRGDVLRLVVGQGLKLTFLGMAAGVMGALALTRFLSSLLYGVKPTDPITLIGALGILTSIALLAACIPARRATRVDPMVALRYE